MKAKVVCIGLAQMVCVCACFFFSSFAEMCKVVHDTWKRNTKPCNRSGNRAFKKYLKEKKSKSQQSASNALLVSMQHGKSYLYALQDVYGFGHSRNTESDVTGIFANITH